MIRAGGAGPACTVCIFAVLLACHPAPDPPTLDLPPRAAAAPGGAEFVRSLRGLELAEREARILAQVMGGNIPDWLRELVPVELALGPDGRSERLTFWAMPDYLAVGSDTDYVYLPVSPRTARTIADEVGGSLPTARMVDAVWLAARARLVPIRIQPDEDMWTVRYLERHSRMVQAQRRQQRSRPGDFVAGHKLDVVRPTWPAAEAGEAALYGWHLPDGTPIQPFYRVPDDSRPHFSMGVRMVHRDVLMDGAPADLEELLADPARARWLGES